jgi:hypothetical protein
MTEQDDITYTQTVERRRGERQAINSEGTGAVLLRLSQQTQWMPGDSLSKLRYAKARFLGQVRATPAVLWHLSP